MLSENPSHFTVCLPVVVVRNKDGTNRVHACGLPTVKSCYPVRSDTHAKGGLTCYTMMLCVKFRISGRSMQNNILGSLFSNLPRNHASLIQDGGYQLLRNLLSFLPQEIRRKYHFDNSVGYLI